MLMPANRERIACRDRTSVLSIVKQLLITASRMDWESTPDIKKNNFILSSTKAGRLVCKTFMSFSNQYKFTMRLI